MNLDWEEIARINTHRMQLHILELLEDGERSPTMISDETGEALGNVSYHMNVLKTQGLAKVTRTVPRRGAVEHFYVITKRAKK